MPFTFKLSQRLARMRTAWVLVPAVVASITSCELRPRGPATGVDPITQVMVTPNVVTLDPFQSFQFQAYGVTQAGDSVFAPVNWSSSVGPITSSGVYTADTSAVDATVTATLSGSSVKGSSNVKKRRVVKLIVSPKSVTMPAGAVWQFTSYGRTNTGDSLNVSVSYTATGGAITNGGFYTAGQSAGAYRVIARQNSGSLADTSAVTVQVVPVASVIVNPATVSVTTGQTAQLAATTLDAGGSPLLGRAITWVSNNPAVATVNSNGLVSAVAAGTAAITATSESQSGNSTVTVSVVPVASVTVSPGSANELVGQTTQLTATPKDAGGNPLPGRIVTWGTTNSAVATVNGSGVVSGIAPGAASITATSEGQTGTGTVTVSVVPVASVAVNPATASVLAGQTAQLTAATNDANGIPLAGRVVTWATSNAAIASVDGNGLVTGVAAGTATITATSEGKSGTASVTVTASQPADPGRVTNLTVASVGANSVTLSFTEVNNGLGQPATYDVRFTAGSMNWPSATSVAQGTCTTPVAGTTIGAMRTCTITGLASATAYQFQVVAFRGTLNVDAVFGALSNIASGTTGSSTAPVATVTVVPASGTIAIGQVLQLSTVLKDASGNVLTGRVVTWSSSSTTIVTISTNGLVTAMLVGTTTITATSEGKTGSSTVTVSASVPSGEPVLNVANGDLLIYQDNMDQYTTPHDMDSWPGYSIHPFYPDQYPNNYAVITSAHGSSGKALRLVYINGGGERFIWKTNPENISTWYSPPSAAFVLQYWFRISKNGGPGGGPGFGSTAVGMKWMEMWNVGAGARTQFSVTAGNSSTGPLWHVNPASRNPVGYQPVGPYWNQVNNNQWHRVTYVYQPASSPGATDGVARMWIDGTKIVDVSAAAAGITPPGGTKVWCTLAEVGTLDVAQTGMINLGEYMNGVRGDGVTDLPMTLDFDDLVWWRLPARIP